MGLRDTLTALFQTHGRDAHKVAQGYRQLGDAAFKDMAGFARINEASPDDYGESRRIEGRREMFWHVANMRQLNPEDIERLVNEDGWNEPES